MCRRFNLVRDEHDGINQPGVVAEGVIFHPSKVVICWVQYPHSVQMFDSVADVLMVQKQNGVTRLVWTDPSERTEPASPPGSYTQLKGAMAALASVLGEDHVLVSSESSRSLKLDFAREHVSGSFPAYASKAQTPN